MTAIESRCFEFARRAAELSDFKRVHIGCVIAERGKILAAGWNSSRTHPIQSYYNRYRTFREGTSVLPAQLHAETSATLPLRNMDVDWSHVDIYIYRIRKDQPFGLAEPCSACRKYLEDLGIKSIYYTTNNGYVHEKVDGREYLS